MGLLATIATALGFGRPFVVAEPGPVTLTAEGRSRLAALPDGHALLLRTAPTPDGWIVHADEVPASGPVRDELGGPLLVDDAVLERLQGLELDYAHGRWRVVLDLAIRSGSTPNPNGRLYEITRPLARGRPLFFTRDRSNPPLARALLDIGGVVSVLLRDNTLTVERTHDTDWAWLDRQIDTTLRQYFLFCGQAIDAETVPTRDDPLAAEVQRILDTQILPGVHRDGGNIELVDVSEDGVVRVKMTGACHSCPASGLTLKAGVEKALTEALPGRVTEVLAV